MRAVITVIGQDTVGIISKVSAYLAEKKINIVDITQSVLSEFFCMVMLVDLESSTEAFSDTVDALGVIGRENHLDIHAMHEDIFNSMHKI